MNNTLSTKTLGSLALYAAAAVLVKWALADPGPAAAPNSAAGMSPVIAPGSAAGMSPVIADSATLQKVQGGFAFTEGPAADAHGNVYFTDQPNDRILIWHAGDGKITTFLQPCGRSNGLCFDARGDLWACADEKNELWKITPRGKKTVALFDFAGKLLNGPNDVWLRPDGGIYFTDPYYARAYWHRGPMEQSCQGVYFLAPGHKTPSRVVDDMRTPNGIIGTPDGKTLYISDLGAGKTFSYRIESDGSLSNKTLFCDQGSDGMTIDDAGDVYLCGQGVTVFDSAGKRIEHIPVAEAWTGNVCFGGRDRRTLFITASTSVYTIRMRVAGVGSQ